MQGMKSKTGLGAILFSVVCLFFSCITAPGASSLNPVTVRETCKNLWEAGNYPELSSYALSVKDSWLAYPERDYYTTVVMAHAFFHTGRFSESLPYYEAALLLYPKKETLWLYSRAVEDCSCYDRGIEYLSRLGTRYPDQQDLLSGLQRLFTYYSVIAQADLFYHNNQNNEAASLYSQALKEVGRLPVNDTEWKAWREGLGESAIDREYTTWRFYQGIEGWREKRYSVPHLLEIKLHLTSALYSDPPEKVLNYAAVIIRNSSYTYTFNGETISEANTLGNEELERIQQSWQLVSDIIRYGTGGRVAVHTEWIDLPGATLTSITTGNYLGLFETAHFDPGAVQPSPAALYNMISGSFDGVVFAWPRGKAPKNYGGGKTILPFTEGSRVLKYIGSITDNTLINLHEFLHGYEQDLLPHLRVHGPVGDVPPDFSGKSEADWYLYLVDALVR